MSPIEVFISHSSQNKPVAKALVALLRAALDIPAAQIRCTSVEGFKPPAGALTERQLRAELLSAKVFIGLVTPESLQSTYVLFEFGARWGADLHLTPLLGAGARPNILRSPLSERNVLSCESHGDLQQLVGEVAKELGKTPGAAQTYQDQLEDLARKARVKAKGRTTEPPIAGICFGVLNGLSGKCLDLDLSTGGKKDGDRIQQWRFHGGTNQLWFLRPVDQQYFAIVSKHSKKCLGVVGGNRKEGAKVHQSRFLGADRQQWKFERIGEDFYRIVAKHSGLCLDVSLASREDGAPILQFTPHEGANQKWQLRCVI